MSRWTLNDAFVEGMLAEKGAEYWVNRYMVGPSYQYAQSYHYAQQRLADRRPGSWEQVGGKWFSRSGLWHRFAHESQLRESQPHR
jgi:hypothetical protein